MFDGSFEHGAFNRVEKETIRRMDIAANGFFYGAELCLSYASPLKGLQTGKYGPKRVERYVVPIAGIPVPQKTEETWINKRTDHKYSDLKEDW